MPVVSYASILSNLFFMDHVIVTKGVNEVDQKQEEIGPGVVVLSPSLQVLFINRRAVALLNQLEQTAESIGPNRDLAAPMRQHCQDIIETLEARLSSHNWEQFQQCRTIGDSDHSSIILKGFGIPDRRGLSYSRIVMLLSPLIQPIPAINGEESSSITARISPKKVSV
jgi:hypothetical protein